jgi:hypothetical protein
MHHLCALHAIGNGDDPGDTGGGNHCDNILFRSHQQELDLSKDILRYASSLLADFTPIAEHRTLREGGEALGGICTDPMADEVLVDGKAKMHRHGLKDKYPSAFPMTLYWAPPAAVIPASWERMASLMIIPLANPRSTNSLRNPSPLSLLRQREMVWTPMILPSGISNDSYSKNLRAEIKAKRSN